MNRRQLFGLLPGLTAASLTAGSGKLPGPFSIGPAELEAGARKNYTINEIRSSYGLEPLNDESAVLVRIVN